MDKDMCTEFCPDPRDVTDLDSAREQWSKIDTCAKRYTHYCKHDHVASGADGDDAEYSVCYNVLQHIEHEE